MAKRSFHMPTRVVQQAGLLAHTADYVALFGHRPLLVTGSRAARAHGWIDTLRGVLPGLIVFEGIEENPSTETCDRVAAMAREEGADLIVALGGGSPLDAAKAAAVGATNAGSCAQYFGRDQYPVPALPLIALPTTAGSGSEVTPYAVLVDTAQRLKRTLAGSDLFPRIALLDPELTVPLPRDYTVATGLDALSQAMEGYVSRSATDVGDLLALEACRIIRQWLPVVAREPDNLEARGQMMYAANLSGAIIAQSGTTLVHGMGYYYTLHHGVAHGLANALLLTPVFEWNARHLPQKVANLAHALGVLCPPHPEAAAVAIREALHSLLHDLEVSPAARDAGVDAAALDGHAQELAGDSYRFKNQVGEFTVQDLTAVYEASWEGSQASFN